VKEQAWWDRGSGTYRTIECSGEGKEFVGVQFETHVEVICLGSISQDIRRHKPQAAAPHTGGQETESGESGSALCMDGEGGWRVSRVCLVRHTTFRVARHQRADVGGISCVLDPLYIIKSDGNNLPGR
jgi:hypothetical protein